MDERERSALEEMRRSAGRAMAWAADAGRDWTSDEKTVAAVAHAVAQVGERARSVSQRARADHPEIPWAAIVGMRDRIYHDYGHVDPAVLRETVRRDLPDLDRQLAAILANA